MADDFANVPYQDSVQIYRPFHFPNTLFTPALPSVISLQFLVAPKFDNNDAKLEEEVVSLQTAMELDDDTLTFLKIVVMFADVAAVHLDLEKDYVKQDTSAVVSYVTESIRKVFKRFPKLEDYFYDGWPAYSFAEIYLTQLQRREERRRHLEHQREEVRSLLHSVYEQLQFDSPPSLDA